MPAREDPPRYIDDVLRRMLAAREARIVELEADRAARDGMIAARDGVIAGLGEQVAARDGQIAVRDELIARQHALIVEQTGLIEARDAVVAAQGGHIVGLEREAAILARLIGALEFPQGPASLRAVLPVARLVRRLIRR